MFFWSLQEYPVELNIQAGKAGGAEDMVED